MADNEETSAPATAEATATAAAVAPAAAWLSPVEDALWRQLLTIHARVAGRLDEDLRATHDLSLADYDVLVALSEAPSRSLRMRELAGRVLLSPSGLTRRVDRLVARGLVTREPCEADGRGAFATMTGAGLGLLGAAAPTHVAGVRRYLLDPVGASVLPRLAAGVAEVTAALDRAG